MASCRRGHHSLLIVEPAAARQPPLDLALELLDDDHRRHAGRERAARDPALSSSPSSRSSSSSRPSRPSPRAGASGSSGSGEGGAPAMTARFRAHHAARRRVPGDPRLAAVRLDGPRARPARRRVALHRGRDLLVQVNAQPYSNHDWHWRLLVAHQFGHAAAAPTAHGTLRLLDDAGIARRARAARAAHGPRRAVQMWGRARVRAPGVPPHPRAVVARVVAVFDDLLFGSNVSGCSSADRPRGADGAAPTVDRWRTDVLVVDLATPASTGRAGRAAARRRRAGEARTLGVYSHVHDDLKRRAEAAGFDLVVPRSRMAREGAGARRAARPLLRVRDAARRASCRTRADVERLVEDPELARPSAPTRAAARVEHAERRHAGRERRRRPRRAAPPAPRGRARGSPPSIAATALSGSRCASP